MPQSLHVRSLILASALAFSTPALASPVNPWGVHVGKKVVAITPFLYADTSPTFYPYLYGQYGVTEQFELLAGVGAALGSDSYVEGIEFMPRYFFSETSGLALHTHYYFGEGAPITLAPEYHGIYEIGAMTLTVNTGWGPSIVAGELALGPVYAQVAPEYYFTDSSSLFVELNPEYDLTDYGGADVDRFYMEVVPGVSTAIAETHYFAFGLHVPVTGFTADGIYFGMWYSIAFGGE